MIPTDEEIEKAMHEEFEGYPAHGFQAYFDGFKDCAKWMRERCGSGLQWKKPSEEMPTPSTVVLFYDNMHNLDVALFEKPDEWILQGLTGTLPDAAIRGWAYIEPPDWLK